MVKGSKKKGRDPFKKAPGGLKPSKGAKPRKQRKAQIGKALVWWLENQDNYLPLKAFFETCHVRSLLEGIVSWIFALDTRNSFISDAPELVSQVLFLANQLDSDDLRCCHSVHISLKSPT